MCLSPLHFHWPGKGETVFHLPEPHYDHSSEEMVESERPLKYLLLVMGITHKTHHPGTSLITQRVCRLLPFSTAFPPELWSELKPVFSVGLKNTELGQVCFLLSLCTDKHIVQRQTPWLSLEKFPWPVLGGLEPFPTALTDHMLLLCCFYLVPFFSLWRTRESVLGTDFSSTVLGWWDTLLKSAVKRNRVLRSLWSCSPP